MAYLNCTNCKKDLIEGDMCRDCASFLRPQDEMIGSPLEDTVVKKVVKAIKKVGKKRK